MPTSSAATKPDSHRQRQKMLLRRSCRQIKELSATLSSGDVDVDLTIELLEQNEAALKAIFTACSEDEGAEKEKEIEAVLGSQLRPFLRDLRKMMEQSSQGQTSTGMEESETKRKGAALLNLLALTSALQQNLQKRDDQAVEIRKQWEEQHPILASQEYELSLYTKPLLDLLSAESPGSIPTAQWEGLEKSLQSLQVYLLENKISAEQVGTSGERSLEIVSREVLERFRKWDSEGFGSLREGDTEKNVETAERIWGRVDKIGSGLNYLLTLDARGDVVDGVKPTTRSVFLLKSAPPAKFRFSATKDEWYETQLARMRDILYSIVLDPKEPDIRRDDEVRWNAAYQELEALEKFLNGSGKNVSLKSIQASKIDETIGLLCARLESLHMQLKSGEDDSAFALMYVSWELAMRIGVVFAHKLEHEQKLPCTVTTVPWI